MHGGLGGIRTGAAILLLLAAAAMAPVVDDIIVFLSEAPYVQFLPAAEDEEDSAAGASRLRAVLPSGHGGDFGRRAR